MFRVVDETMLLAARCSPLCYGDASIRYLSLRFCACCRGQQAAFDKVHSRVRHFGGVFAFPYKNTWATRCIPAHTLCPAGRGPALSLMLGVAGCNSRAGLVRFPHAQADYELGHGGHDRVCCTARLHARMHTPDHHLWSFAHTHTPVPSSSLTMNLRVPARCPGRVQQEPLLRA